MIQKSGGPYDRRLIFAYIINALIIFFNLYHTLFAPLFMQWLSSLSVIFTACFMISYEILIFLQTSGTKNVVKYIADFFHLLSLKFIKKSRMSWFARCAASPFHISEKQ